MLSLWSAPRCRSTVFLRMMVERGDFTVLHEPFSHLKDFGEAIVEQQSYANEQQLIHAILELGRDQRVFLKDTTDFYYPAVLANRNFLRDVQHTFIVRHPQEAIASHYALNPQLGRNEIGFARLREIYDTVRCVSGQNPIVLDANDLVNSPSEVVQNYCEATGIPFIPQALSWTSGALPFWKHTARWHVDASASEGIEKQRSSRPATDVENHPTLGEFYRYHLPHYEWLWSQRLVVAVHTDASREFT